MVGREISFWKTSGFTRLKLDEPMTVINNDGNFRTNVDFKYGDFDYKEIVLKVYHLINVLYTCPDRQN